MTNSEYRLDIYTAGGAKVAELTDFLTLSYQRKVNAPGLLSVSLLGDHRAIGQMEYNSTVVLYRRNIGLGFDWTHEFTGLMRSWRMRYTDHNLYEATMPGIMTMLSWRIVAWPAGTSNRSMFSSVKAETIMKTLVNYNAGANATTSNGRIRAGTISGLSVEADGGHGNTLTFACAYDNLLDTLQTIAAVGGGDFDLVRTGASTYEFCWYTGQLGSDRSASVIFSLERGNLAEPQYTNDHLDERTVAIVGGQGEGDIRDIVVRTGTGYSASNDMEVFVDARSVAETGGLAVRGDARLRDLRAKRDFGFRITQTPGCSYGVNYMLGDLITAQYGGISEVRKITGVTVSLANNGSEQIEVETQAVV